MTFMRARTGRLVRTVPAIMILLLIAAGADGLRSTSVQDVGDALTTARADGPTVLITGANRGLGLEFAKQYSAAGWNVIATARKPADAEVLNSLEVTVVQLDVADAESVAAMKKTIDGQAIDLLINNAGISGRGVGRTLESADFKMIDRVLQVNTLGPMRVTQALLPNLRAGEKKLVVNISSGLGSITNNTGGGFYGYRESKAALNMFTRSLAGELRDEGFTCIVMSPGWVRTDMGGPQAQISPEESISAMRKVIEGLTPENSGEFWRYTGKQVEW